MTGQMELMVKYLVHLQFYSEEEGILFSRDKKVRIPLPEARSVILAFEDDLKRHLHLIETGAYSQYLEKVAEVLPIRSTEVEWEFQKNIRELGESGLSAELATNFLVGPIRSTLQSREFEVFIDRLKREVRRRLTGPLQETTLDGLLAELYSTNDESISILYNLVFLRLLITIYGDSAILETVESLISRYSEEVATKLTS
ncbi:MAG: hypothetical protein EAX95_07180 [Candidatus Thorarchaeota archaeon]|nr:hypothetical protein [Candidatus Thorarchaeota archaeon]